MTKLLRRFMREPVRERSISQIGGWAQGERTAALKPRGAVVDVVVEVQDRSHGEAVLAALVTLGFNAEEKTA